MNIKVSEQTIDTVCNSLRASKHSLKSQLSRAIDENKKEIIEHQLNDVEHALSVFNIIQ